MDLHLIRLSLRYGHAPTWAHDLPMEDVVLMLAADVAEDEIKRYLRDWRAAQTYGGGG